LSLAWDCGTGNGQAALALAAHFDQVIATDPSQAQLAQAPRHTKVEFRLALEKDSGLASHSVDLVTAAQAAHWFDSSAFNKEAARVLRPGGIVAIWCYNLLRIAPGIDETILRFYAEIVGPYWPPERRHTEAGYQTLPFPFPELPFPEIRMQHDWTLEELGAYVRSWSAVMHFARQRGFDPVEALLQDLSRLWGAPEVRRLIQWPLAGRIGRIP
jgi:SAM-dependent methyltransferase